MVTLLRWVWDSPRALEHWGTSWSPCAHLLSLNRGRAGAAEVRGDPGQEGLWWIRASPIHLLPVENLELLGPFSSCDENVGQVPYQYMVASVAQSGTHLTCSC